LHKKDRTRTTTTAANVQEKGKQAEVNNESDVKIEGDRKRKQER